jgi:60kDa lysophospholipase
MTGGTICMEKSDYGLIPARNFLERCMAPRPEFNDGSAQDEVEVRVQVEGSIASKSIRSLRTPLSSYGKRIRYV